MFGSDLAELTLAQIRENLPNGWADWQQISTHVTLIWDWIYAKQIAPRYTREALGQFRGSTIQKYGEAVRLTPTLVHVCRFIY